MTEGVAAQKVDVRREFEKKVAAGIFNPVQRSLHPSIAEDQLQEGVARAYECYARKALEEGVLLDDPLLVCICRRRACDPSRRLAGAAGAQPSTDVYDFRNYRDGKIEVVRLDGLDDGGDGGGDESGSDWPRSCRPTRPARSSRPST
jgi:hypothetical protein